jgi:hypothetical protein
MRLEIMMLSQIIQTQKAKDYKFSLICGSNVKKEERKKCKERKERRGNTLKYKAGY